MANPILERITKLVETLKPLGGKSRGMTIEADDWNMLVQVVRGVLQIERLQETMQQAALEERFAPRQHRHVGEIDAASLAPELQSALGNGGGSASTRLALNDAEQRLEAFGREMARVAEVTERQQRLLDEGQAEDHARANRLRELNTRFEAVERLRGSMTGLTAQVERLSRGMQDVLQLRKTLRYPNGDPIDVASIAGRVEILETLRDNLRGVDGELVRIRDLELRLEELADIAGAGGGRGLGARIEEATAAAEERVNARLDERLAGHASATDTRVDAKVGELRVQLDERSNALREELGTGAGSAVDDAEGRLRGSLAAELETMATKLRSELSTTTAELMDARIRALGTERRDIATTMAGLQRDVAKLSTELQARVGEIRATAAELTEFRTKVEPRLTAVETRVGGR